MIGAAFKARRGSWAKNPQMQSVSLSFAYLLKNLHLKKLICSFKYALYKKQNNFVHFMKFVVLARQAAPSLKSGLQSKKLRKASGSDKVSKPKADTCANTNASWQNWRLLGVFSATHVVVTRCVQTNAESSVFFCQMFCQQCYWHSNLPFAEWKRQKDVEKPHYPNSTWTHTPPPFI